MVLICFRFENFLSSHIGGPKTEEQEISKSPKCENIKNERTSPGSYNDQDKIPKTSSEQVGSTKGAFTMMHDHVTE